MKCYDCGVLEGYISLNYEIFENGNRYFVCKDCIRKRDDYGCKGSVKATKEMKQCFYCYKSFKKYEPHKSIVKQGKYVLCCSGCYTSKYCKEY